MKPVVDDAGVLLPEPGEGGSPTAMTLLPQGTESSSESLLTLLYLTGDGGEQGRDDGGGQEHSQRLHLLQQHPQEWGQLPGADEKCREGGPPGAPEG